jgi:hypothetical protein
MEEDDKLAKNLVTAIQRWVGVEAKLSKKEEELSILEENIRSFASDFDAYEPAEDVSVLEVFVQTREKIHRSFEALQKKLNRVEQEAQSGDRRLEELREINEKQEATIRGLDAIARSRKGIFDAARKLAIRLGWDNSTNDEAIAVEDFWKFVEGLSEPAPTSYSEALRSLLNRFYHPVYRYGTTANEADTQRRIALDRLCERLNFLEDFHRTFGTEWAAVKQSDVASLKAIADVLKDFPSITTPEKLRDGLKWPLDAEREKRKLEVEVSNLTLERDRWVERNKVLEARLDAISKALEIREVGDA